MTIQADAGDLTIIGSRTPTSQMPFTAVLVRWGTGLAGLVMLTWLLSANPPDDYRYVLAFAVAMIAADLLLTVRMAPGVYYSIGSIFLFVYFILGGGITAALVDGIARLSVWLLRFFRRKASQTPLYAFFHVGQAILATLTAAAVVQWTFEIDAMTREIVEHRIGALIVFAVVYLIVYSALTSLAVFSRAGFRELRIQLWPKSTLWAAVSVLTNLPFAIVIMLLGPTMGYRSAAAFIFAIVAGIALILRLNVGLRQGYEEIKTLNRIGSLISATLDLPELMRIIARESRRVLQADGFFVALTEKDDDEVTIVFMTSGGEEIERRKINRHAGLTGKAMETGELIHYERGEHERNDPDDTLRSQRRPRSIVVAPMKFSSEIIGALSVQSYQPDVYDSSQLQLFQTIAGQAAIAIRNAQLFQSEQRAKNERDEFLSLVTHEIKNPLTSIRGYTELADDAVRNGEQSSALESINVIRTEAERIFRLAEDLLDASKMAAGKFKLSIEETDLTEVVSQIADRYSATSGREIAVEIPQSMKIPADPIRLGQLVENLLSNSVKYSEAGTAIRIAVRSDQAHVYLSVIDQGPGIAPEKVPLIFERYYRVEEGGSVVSGTGIGLFVSREIAKAHGGSLDVISVLGKGSTFTVTLPASVPGP